MPLVKAKPMRFRPRSLSDTLDGDNSPDGACSALINLIQDPTTPSCLQCRPAAIDLSTFSGFTAPGVVSQAVQSNNRIYGFIASGRNSGKDEPFCYDLVAEAFITVSGITNANTPFTQVTTGDWTPPTLSVVGTRVIATHPGFLGVTGCVLGYFDLSSYTETAAGNITSSSPTITGNIPIGALGPGYKASGTGIPAGATITNAVPITPQSTGSTTSGSNSITSVAAIAGFAVGQTIAGVGIPSGTTITAVSGTTITISNNATATGTLVTISASGTVITLSANATATTNGLSITLTGGTTSAPLWCAGNTFTVPLPGVATNVNNFNNRAYISYQQYLAFCDPLTLNLSFATNVLTIGDVAPITALQPLTIINPATSAPVQGLLAFKQNLITLITGDPTTSNLANNTLSPSGVGTTSPNAVCATTVGVYFVDVDGLRCVELSGNITDPLPDVRVPFINAIYRTRISAAYNVGVYRVCLQNGAATGTPWQEYWFDLKYKLWTGPHTFQQQVAVPWQATFIAFSNNYPAVMYQSDVVQSATSQFTENGAQLVFTYGTCALPDNEDLMYNSLVVSSINCAFKAGTPSLQCVATDENGTVVGLGTIVAPGSASYWDTMIWGSNIWYGLQYGLQPRQIPWTAGVVFSKLVLTISANSSLGFQISNFQALYQPLGYVDTPIAAAANSAPPYVPPVSYTWDAGHTWDSGIDWQG